MNRYSLVIIVIILNLAEFNCTSFYRSPAKQVTDKQITGAIKNEFIFDADVILHRINITTNDGIVTLSGVVDNLLSRDRAQKLARSIKGVQKVINKIDVDPAGIGDKEIKKNIDRALFTDPVTESYEIETSVNDGIVTLSGHVDSWAERKICTVIVKSVRGVKQVNDELSVKTGTARDDKDIELEIKKVFELDARIDAAFIDVVVEDGVVMLTGFVGSALEKKRAEEISHVFGVNSVDSEELKVQWWARNEMKKQQISSSTYTDEEIERAIYYAYKNDPRISTFKIDVKVENGNVMLEGQVNNLTAKYAAISRAENIAGVRNVKNFLKVGDTKTNQDIQIVNYINAALSRDAYLSTKGIDIDVKNGRVYLKGHLNNLFEVQRAEKVVSSIKGVSKVINFLQYDITESKTSDWALRNNIIYGLKWNPDVDDQNIDVSVKNGEVILTGKVDSMYEWKEANQEARKSGAESVINNIKIIYDPF